MVSARLFVFEFRMQLVPLFLGDFFHVSAVTRRVKPPSETVEFGGGELSAQSFLFDPHTNQVKMIVILVKLGTFECETKKLARRDLRHVHEVALVASIFVKNSSADVASPILDHSLGIIVGIVLPRTHRFDDLRDEAQGFRIKRPAARVPIDGQESGGLIRDPPSVVFKGKSTHNISYNWTFRKLYGRSLKFQGRVKPEPAPPLPRSFAT